MAALRSIFGNYTHQNAQLPLMVTDLGVVQRQYDRWVKNLPTIRPFYAVKCNPAAPLLQQLAAAGAGFDCASQAEIRAALDTGVQPEDIIFANPIKTFSDVAFARSVGVKCMTFDNLAELEKVHALFPEAELVLRMLADDSGSLMRFGSKFGASLGQSELLLKRVQELGMRVVGVSFHIGSGCFGPNIYEGAMKMARELADMAAAQGLEPFKLLDIGGGFPGDATPHAVSADGVPAFETFAEVISVSVARHFPSVAFPGLTVISEPGRYFATAAGTLFTLVQGKRSSKEIRAATGNPEAERVMYYVNDGVYGSFNSILFDHAKPDPQIAEDFFMEEQQPHIHMHTQPLQHASPTPIRSLASACGFSAAAPAMLSSTIFGPTCDSLDVLATDLPMRELRVGDWLVFANMGAYTGAAASKFNGVPLPISQFVRSLKP